MAKKKSETILPVTNSSFHVENFKPQLMEDKTIEVKDEYKYSIGVTAKLSLNYPIRGLRSKTGKVVGYDESDGTIIIELENGNLLSTPEKYLD
jgi:hypothetical protein